MSMTEHVTCKLCGRELANKYNLSKHVRCVHRRTDLNSEDADVEELKCPYGECSFSSMYSQELKRHSQKCTFAVAHRIVEQEKQKWQESEKHIRNSYEQKIADSKLFIASLQAENEVLRSQLERAHKLNERAIDRPTTSTTNNNNVKVTNYLSDNKTYEAQTDPKHVRAMLDQHLEEYFMDGQQGLARWVVDHIIRSKEGKMIMVCTDTARKRFRFVNVKGNIEEDLRAKQLTKKLSIPVRQVGGAVFGRIVERLQQELDASDGQGGQKKNRQC